MKLPSLGFLRVCLNVKPLGAKLKPWGNGIAWGQIVATFSFFCNKRVIKAMWRHFLGVFLGVRGVVKALQGVGFAVICRTFGGHTCRESSRSQNVPGSRLPLFRALFAECIMSTNALAPRLWQLRWNLIIHCAPISFRQIS